MHLRDAGTGHLQAGVGLLAVRFRIGESAARAASFTADRAVSRRPSRPLSSPSGRPPSVVSKVPAAISRAPESAFRVFLHASSGAANHRNGQRSGNRTGHWSTSPWASSMMTVSCSGRTFIPSKALMASRA